MVSLLQPTQESERELQLRPERRYLVLYLPRWETDCLKRADPDIGALTTPFALWEKQRGAMRLVAVDDAAAAAGLSVGQSLSDARAICPPLRVREIDRDFIAQSFADFADWHSNASPIVSVLTDKMAWGDLALDITGVSHLFGGEPSMLETVTSRLAGMGIRVRGAIGPSVGAAWALAHFGTQSVIGHDLKAVLAELPVAGLRLEDDQSTKLNHLGLKLIGQLMGRDRRSLQARFGASLLLRLDQALGDIEERITPRLPPAERFVERRFPEPIGLMDDVLMTARDLAFRLSSLLESEAMGAQAFHLFLYRVDHKVMTLSVNAGRATRDAGHIARLFANRADRLGGEYDAGFGIDMIRLGASSVSCLDASNIGIFDAEDGTADLGQLYDRMTSRLGPLAVVRSTFVNTHIPEKAVKLVSVLVHVPTESFAEPDRSLRRPLRLLPQPEPIVVTFAEVPDGPPPGMVWRRVSYKFVRASGPERIGVEWWHLSEPLVFTPRPSDIDMAEQIMPVAICEDKTPPVILDAAINDGIGLTRDYYIAEDTQGLRFWLFREGLYGSVVEPRWFMHGLFS